MIMGLIDPTSGSIRVFGYDMAHERHNVLGRMNLESPYVDMPHRYCGGTKATTSSKMYRFFIFF
jgi:ABC-2 type transport system ATP-binding protein